MKKILLTLLAAVILCISAAGLAEGSNMWFDKTAGTVFEGETLETVLNREGDAAEGEVTFQSSNTKVLTVDESGTVTGVFRGKAVVTAVVKTEKKTYQAKLQVTVARKAVSLEVNTSKLPVYDPADPLIKDLLQVREKEEENALPVLLVSLKKSISIPCRVLPSDATSQKTLLSSEDAEADENEKVIAIKGNTVTGVKAGETILTLANELSPEVCTRFRILVIQPVTRIALAATAPTVAVGSTIPLSVVLTPEDATIQSVSWASGTENIASVDENGMLTGLKRGNARIIVTAADGSNVRANISVRVTQIAESITLDKPEATVDISRNILLKATVLPRDTDDKGVLWTSSDESIATVNAQGRVTGVNVGQCEIICTSKTSEEVTARALVHVQKPVAKIILDPAPPIYAGETGKLTWTVEPADATNPAVRFTSANPSILTVSEDGTVTGLKRGTAYVDAVSTDGSNRKARIRVQIMQHLTGVHMLRKAAYIGVKETATAGAVLEPHDADNNRMTWVSADPEIATVKGDTNRIKLTGVRAGYTVVTGTAEDGGFQTSIEVYVGDWDAMATLLSKNCRVNGDASVTLVARNAGDLPVNGITVEISVWDVDGEPVPANSKDGSNVFKMVYRKSLKPGQTTREEDWQYIDYKRPAALNVSEFRVKIVQYQIDNDWIKVIPKYKQKEIKLPVHI